MKTAPPSWRPDTAADPEALIKEARRRQRRRHMAIGLVIAVMLTGAVTAGVVGTGGHSPGRRSPHRTPGSAGAFGRSALPRFFADAVTTGEGDESLQVRASASGTLVAQEGAGVFGLAATGADSFVIALQAGDGCATRLYRVRLDGQGRPGGLSPVGPELPGLVWSLAAGGQVIGYAVSGCAKGDPGYLGIFDTRTGRSRQWSDVNLGGVSPGNVAVSGALSMTSDGRLLAFTGWNVAGTGRNTSQVVRVLPTTSPPGTVAERSHVVLTRPVSQPELAAASLSPSGAFFYLCTQTWSRTGLTTNVTGYLTSSGEPQEDLASFSGSPAQMACSMALDTSGRFLLVPYSLNPAGRRPTLKVAEIDVTTRAVITMTIQLPGSAGMDPPTGINAAW